MDPDIHGMLRDLVRITGSWLMNFPSIASRDKSIAQASNDLVGQKHLVKPSQEFTEIAHRNKIISDSDAHEMELIAETANFVDSSGRKASARMIGSAKNLMLTGAEVIANSMIDQNYSLSDKYSDLIKNTFETIYAAKPQVKIITASLPKNVGEAFDYVIRNSSMSKYPIVEVPNLYNDPDEDVRMDKSRILSDREKEVLKWAAAGKTMWEIGEILSISQITVNGHLRSARKKIGAVNTTQAVVKAIQQKKIDI